MRRALDFVAASRDFCCRWNPGDHDAPRIPFDSVRAIPEVIDGIRYNCKCAHSDGFFSLLSCYEGKDAMARECAICQGQGRLAVRLHEAGKSLDAIRAAVDAKFG